MYNTFNITNSDLITNSTLPSSQYLRSFNILPDVHFKDQFQDEKVLLLLRRHPITQISWVLKSLVVFGFLIAICSILLLYLSAIQVIYIFCFGAGVIFSYMYINLVRWIYNVGIITNQRIIDIDLDFFTSLKISATTINEIADVNARQIGFWGAIFHFGLVNISTRANSCAVSFDDCPKPTYVVNLVSNLMENIDKEQYG